MSPRPRQTRRARKPTPGAASDQEVSAARAAMHAMGLVLVPLPSDAHTPHNEGANEGEEALFGKPFDAGFATLRIGARLAMSDHIPDQAVVGLFTEIAHNYWSATMLVDGASAALDAWEEFAARPDLSSYGTNALSAAGGLLSRAFRRRVLRSWVLHYDFNLAAVARELRMGANGTPVIRAMAELGLSDMLEEARRAGKAAPGGYRNRPPEGPPPPPVTMSSDPSEVEIVRARIAATRSRIVELQEELPLLEGRLAALDKKST